MPSTLIRAFSYNDVAATLEVTFASGAIYHYYQVPPDIAHQMRQAFAKGEYFNRFIRGKYRFQRMSTRSA
ncbi:KTSC domain-containing protein [Terricaulis sp.]|uniref:KTSC domain-containing protein n=1 Tax=Terricaulis sp. TaxID=2768686 RepID=UPI002AC41FFA|nr:KTSC domain-containing protein [Terricaulis sp.]MDZ4690945.1 KTSC domain-containing protein [Terricaulis sp.]